MFVLVWYLLVLPGSVLLGINLVVGPGTVAYSFWTWLGAMLLLGALRTPTAKR